MLGLGARWQPQEIGLLSGEGIGAQTQVEPLAAFVDKKSKESQDALKAVGTYTPPLPFMPGKNLVALEKVTPGNTWGGFKGGCDLRIVRRQGDQEIVRSTSFLPLHIGSWRRAMAPLLWHDPARGVQVALPISVRRLRWYLGHGGRRFAVLVARARSGLAAELRPPRMGARVRYERPRSGPRAAPTTITAPSARNWVCRTRRTRKQRRSSVRRPSRAKTSSTPSTRTRTARDCWRSLVRANTPSRFRRSNQRTMPSLATSRWTSPGMIFYSQAKPAPGGSSPSASSCACIPAVGRVGYKGYVAEGHGPFERGVRMGDLKPTLVRTEGVEKQRATIELAQGITVSGELPFEAKLAGDVRTIKTAGRARVLDVTLPRSIIRPALKLDGRQWMAGWSDYAGSDWGRMKAADLMAVTTLAGPHELVITNMPFPPVWDRPFRPVIGQ